MPVKRASAGGRPSRYQTLFPPKPAEENAQKFVNAEAKRKFELEIKERNLHQEKGFVFKEAKYFGLPEELFSAISVHNWKAFALHPQNPIVSIVREFYTNILTGDQTFSMVRGIKVSFSAASVNLHLNLDNVEDEFRKLVDSVSVDDLNKILHSLTLEGTNWVPDKGEGVFLCPRPALLPIPKIWYHFVRTRLLPTTHIETVNKERLVLLHCILEGKRINVGQILQREISACAFKPKGCLFFPSLITELCLRSGVDPTSSDEILPNTAAINTTAIKQFSHSASKPSDKKDSSPSSSGDLLSAVNKLHELVQHNIDQQKQFWAFVKDAHVWTKRMFQLNFSRKLLNSPTFPDNILLPVPQSTQDQATPSHISSPTDHSDEDHDAAPTPPPPKQTPPPPAKATRKGKEKVTEHMPETELDFNREATPSPPPKKKVKKSTPSTKKRSQLVAAEMSHYYSSTDDEPDAQVSPSQKTTSISSRKKAASAQLADPPVVAEESDIEVINEVHKTAARTLSQMAQSAKRRPGLRSTS